MMTIRAISLAFAVVVFGTPDMSPATAQTYPSRTITLVVPFPAGGATDVVARVLAKGLSDRMGQPIIIDNRPGANGAIGSASVAKARPDGYTLVMGGVNTHAMNDGLLKPCPYDVDAEAPNRGGVRLAQLRGELLAGAHGAGGYAAQHHRPARRRECSRSDNPGHT
jgi:tripartite-type tricarboxylate transporter receptor subunit TctC